MGGFKMKASIVLLLAVMSLISACSSRETQLDPIADQLSAAVNRCVIDVRDKGDKYETSENCRSLGESARARAWMAVAVSKSGDPNLTVW
jgi:hypothetical protein